MDSAAHDRAYQLINGFRATQMVRAVARALFMTDIQMLVILGGRERTEEEFRTLFEGADLRLARVIPTTSVFQLIEGVPV